MLLELFAWAVWAVIIAGAVGLVAVVMLLAAAGLLRLLAVALLRLHLRFRPRLGGRPRVR